MKRLLLLPLAAATALATGDFYEESVPTLPAYLKYDRLPKKSLAEIIRETTRGPAPEADYAKSIPALLAEMKGGKAPRELLGKVDALLAAERARPVRESSGLNALLHDLRDLCAGTADAAPAAEYFAWRLEQGEMLGYQLGQAQPREGFGEGKIDEEWIAAIEKRMAAAPPALQPHYRYAQAAHFFRMQKDAGAQERFEKIVADFPEHPRAEAAAYMAARCLYRRSRVFNNDEVTNVEPQTTQAREALNGYLKKYPEGRFVGDVYGWLGGQERQAGHTAAALGWFIKQIEMPGHPEFIQSAGPEIEACLRALHDQPAEVAAALTNARLAQAVVYLAGNEIEPVDGNGSFETPDFVAAWRQALFTELAAALAKKPELFREPGWEPRRVATLALALSGAGDQTQALALVETQAGTASDDLAFARGVVLQRAKKSVEAAEAFAALGAKFPKSPLVPAARVRQALALVDAARSGEAAVALMVIDIQKKPAANSPPPALPEDSTQPAGVVADNAGWDEDDDMSYDIDRRNLAGLGPASPAQARQLLDTILNFAPLPELTAAARDEKFPELARVRLGAVIAARHLARERFAEARPFLTPAQWAKSAAPLAELTTAALAAKSPAEKAATAMKLADAWAAARGQLLTVPLDTQEWRQDVYRDDHPLANFRRLQNGPALGLNGATALDLENRDELRHAFNWWIVASDAQPRTPQAATAIWRALRAMPDIAEVSPFSLERANAKKWEDVSRKLCERLEREHPNAPETKRFAVWWNFGNGRDGDGDPVSRGEFVDVLEKAGAGSESTPEEEVRERVKSIYPGTHRTVEDLREAVQGQLAWARRAISALESQCVVNFLEDLDLFLATPDLTLEVANRYLELRYDTLRSVAVGYGIFPSRKPEKPGEQAGTHREDETLLADLELALADPKFAKVTDFLAFVKLAVTANQWNSIPMTNNKEVRDKDDNAPTFWGRDYVKLEKMCRDWLEKYPKSPKREAAQLLHCRALRHAMSPYVYYRRVPWPAAPRWEGASVAEPIERLKFDAKVWKGALDRYDKEFPKGLYAKDVLSIRADLAVRLKDWKRALQITIDHRENLPRLAPDATNRLGLILSHLAKDEDRADLLAAIRSVDGARAALRDTLVAIEEGPEHPLDRLRGWLLEQVEQ